MNILFWVLQVLLALAFIAAGAGKLAQPKAKLAATPNMAWAGDYEQGQIRMIGWAEVLGGLGLILPTALHILPWLTPIAALGLAALMIGGVMTHSRRKEPFTPALVLAVLSLIVFVGRFWIAPIS
ncbi:DoxX family protein [Deinococcus sp.]|uniref:DoxX family protein n=1 Tax=Deinococcus sp. TaxID=47478 RepID=UPI003C7DF662